MSLQRVRGKIAFLRYPSAEDNTDMLYAISMFIVGVIWMMVLL